MSALPPLPLRGGRRNADILVEKPRLPKLMLEAKVAFSPTSIRSARPMEFAIRKHGTEAAISRRADHMGSSD